MRHPYLAASALAAFGLLSLPSPAVVSTPSIPSALGGNGHNVSFDGRLFLVRDSAGWQARLLRPEAATFLPNGMPDAQGALWSPSSQVLGPPEAVENALAICEADASKAPYACDEGGGPGGPYDCYDIWIIDSDATTPADAGGAVLRRRQLKLWVSDPKGAGAAVHKFEWGGIEPLSPKLMGIEPTVSRDGKLLVWQGHPANDGQIDVLMYSVNQSPCALGGWSAPASISHMYVDPAVIGVYSLAERKLRAADGTPFEDGELFRGAYPWLMPDGDAIVFAAAPMPCKAPEDPPGCGPRRNAMSVIGYPTNWGVAHIDGGINPDTDQTVRLFFSSPGATTFSNLPVTQGKDVWPFFGSNTSNYVELVFDDGLDGDYAGYWHLNESVSHAGELDTTRTPDVSGYFNTATLHGGVGFSTKNDGIIGKALSFDGVDDRLEVPNAQSLNPVNGITIDFWVRPTVSPDCDAQNNYRLLLGKGNIGDGSYTVVFEDNLALQARVLVGGEQQALASPALPLDAWTHVSFEYDGPTGEAGFWFDDVEVATGQLAAGTITASTAPLTIGGPGPRDACPPGDGAFAGQLDEVSVSRYARRLGEPPIGEGGAGGAGSSGSGAGGGPSGSGSGAGAGAGSGAAAGGSNADAEGDAGGCGCRLGGAGASSTGVALLALAALTAAARRAGRGPRRRRS